MAAGPLLAAAETALRAVAVAMTAAAAPTCSAVAEESPGSMAQCAAVAGQGMGWALRASLGRCRLHPREWRGQGAATSTYAGEQLRTCECLELSPKGLAR